MSKKESKTSDGDQASPEAKNGAVNKDQQREWDLAALTKGRPENIEAPFVSLDDLWLLASDCKIDCTSSSTAPPADFDTNEPIGGLGYQVSHGKPKPTGGSDNGETGNSK